MSQRGGGDRSIAQCGEAQETIILSAGAAGASGAGLLCRSAGDTEPLLKPLDDGMDHLQTSRHFSHGYAIVQPCQGTATVQVAQFMSWWHVYPKPDSNEIYTHPTRIKHENC